MGKVRFSWNQKEETGLEEDDRREGKMTDEPKSICRGCAYLPSTRDEESNRSGRGRARCWQYSEVGLEAPSRQATPRGAFPVNKRKHETSQK